MENRVTYISLARLLAAIGVITMHTGEWYVRVSREAYWIQANILTAFAETAIPIFFMISGALLLDYREKYSTKVFLKKRFVKMFAPLLFWFGISLIYGFFKNTSAMSMPYWFFFFMAGMYLCMPVFSAIEKSIRNQIYLYIVLISFVLNYLIPFLADVFDFTITYRIPFDIGLQYLIYILLGYLLHKNEISHKWRIVIYIFAILGFAMKVIGTYVLSLQTGQLDGTFGHYYNVPCFLLSVGMFVFIKELGNRIKSDKAIRGIEFFSGYALASYVLHQYVLEYIIGPFDFEVYTLSYNLIVPIVVYLICVSMAYILRKIPIIRRLVP